MGRDDIYTVLDGEREYQDRKWGTPFGPKKHEVGAWLTLMDTHLRRAQDAWSGARDDQSALDALRKVVALGVACMEEHGAVPRQAELGD